MDDLGGFQVTIPSKIVSLLDDWPIGKNLDERVRSVIAIGLFVGKIVSFAKAAELAGIPLLDFIEGVKKTGIPRADCSILEIYENLSR